jgi:hypothetical protein
VSFVAEIVITKKFFVVVARNFFREVQSKILTGKKLSKTMPSNVRKKSKRLKKET